LRRNPFIGCATIKRWFTTGKFMFVGQRLSTFPKFKTLEKFAEHLLVGDQQRQAANNLTLQQFNIKLTALIFQ
jgi:hypothetical protein